MAAIIETQITPVIPVLETVVNPTKSNTEWATRRTLQGYHRGADPRTEIPDDWKPSNRLTPPPNLGRFPY